jgi:hypothetical protein
VGALLGVVDGRPERPDPADLDPLGRDVEGDAKVAE